jgi:rod shape-determining protein MreD
MERFLRSAGIVLVLLVLQTTFIPYLSVIGFLPDIFLPWLVYVALRRGQVEATIYGFGVGFLQDITAMKFLGLAALSKTICSFVAGYFFNENTTGQTLGSYRFVLIVLLCSFINDVVYFTVFFQGAEGSLIIHVLQFSVASTIYTGVISLLPMFAFSQKYSTSWAQS